MSKRAKEVIDEHGQMRNLRGEWRTGQAAGELPIYAWPPQPKAVLKWLLGWPGYLWPWNAFYVLITALTYFYLTPSIEEMKVLQFDWIFFILIRNMVLLLIFAGSLHLWLFRWRKQGRKFKYNAHWMDKKDSTFLFGNQVYDNMFWSVVSGGIFWTLYEVGLWWAYANNLLPYIDLKTNPVWFIGWMLLMPIWRLFHFYWVHRLIHWGPLYKLCHYLHHKNVNIGPWSGMAMHPIEHFIFFSSMLIHLVVPSHPFHMLFQSLYSGLTPAQGHAGFDEIVWGDENSIKNEHIVHYMHHRYHTVNFGENLIPMDKWFGSYHDGTPEADRAFRERKKKLIEVETAK